MGYPTQFRYSKDHEWIDVKGDVATVGITDYAQSELGDVVFVEVPAAGTQVTAGKTFGSVESVKAVSEIYAPATGEVVEANATLKDKPESINTDPHGTGWLIKMKLANAADVASLMDAAAYEAFIAEKKKEASA
ncbi:MAG TPA: glycine cleavage system protein GcvH [Candidatus Eisenbacteria bacterium]|nr:glycine cleavage system protein GcvH [Candidatus Eisenbacteria bacterium]